MRVTIYRNSDSIAETVKGIVVENQLDVVENAVLTVKKTDEGELKTDEGGLKTDEGGYSTGENSTRENLTRENLTREKILVLIKFNPAITMKEIALALNLSEKGIEWQIKQLRQNGTIKRIGGDRGGKWEIIHTIN